MGEFRGSKATGGVLSGQLGWKLPGGTPDPDSGGAYTDLLTSTWTT
jgi:hypothetical protein